MSENEFRQPVSIDFAPRGSVCEWCGKPATQQLTVIGGKSHNEGGYFCSACAAEFVRTIAESTYRVPTLEEEITLPAD
jgi:protein-arginine kinase activator protein McsA